MKRIIQVAAAAMVIAAGAQYSIVDVDGRVVGTLVTDTPVTSQMRVIGITGTARPATPRQDRRTDRAFHPDYSRAFSIDQMTRSWNDELDRLNPPIVTGGG